MPSYDRTLILIAIALYSIGVIVVTSASMPVADKLFGNPFHFTIRHIIYICLSILTALLVMATPLDFWRKTNPYLLLSAIVLLIVVLFIGRTVNGATRWIAIGPISIQAAEPAKLFFFTYLAGYLVRRYQDLSKGEFINDFVSFIKPILVLMVLGILLLMQPDLGTFVVMMVTTVGLLFMAGANFLVFAFLVVAVFAIITLLILIEEYRMRRVTAFLNPWDDPFGTGYQLTQSLMAYGRGSWFGQGLGNSIQKLEFLPEAHTDFIMAIVAEELGFIGVLLILGLILLLVIKAIRIGNKAIRAGKPYDGFLSYAFGIWFSFQTAVNIGASSGMLPTKGLTLPLISYGGSSLIVMTVAVALLVKIDFELRQSVASTEEPEQ